VEDALRMHGPMLERHHVEITRDFANLPPISLEKHKVLQILVNLIRNAKDSLVTSGLKEKKLVVRTAQDEKNNIVVQVTDNGMGIAPENVNQLFTFGFTTKKEGHGFGLHSGILAAREMGGDLLVQSAGEGRGATFTLQLPMQLQSSSGAERDKQEVAK
jgi:C4-dicarboxylate-specific signal transduction histidine kinase